MTGETLPLYWFLHSVKKKTTVTQWYLVRSIVNFITSANIVPFTLKHIVSELNICLGNHVLTTAPPRPQTIIFFNVFFLGGGGGGGGVYGNSQYRAKGSWGMTFSHQNSFFLNFVADGERLQWRYLNLFHRGLNVCLSEVLMFL